MRILFLGNSFTYFHDLPDMVAEILQAEVKGNLCGGAYLHQHINPSDELCAITNKLLTEEKWDYVVLQDQSQGPITNPEEFAQAVSPQAALLTGRNPANPVIVRLQRAGAKVYTAREHGVMTVYSDGSSIRVVP